MFFIRTGFFTVKESDSMKLMSKVLKLSSIYDKYSPVKQLIAVSLLLKYLQSELFNNFFFWRVSNYASC